MIAHQDVEASGELRRGIDDGGRGPRVGQIRADVAEPGTRGERLFEFRLDRGEIFGASRLSPIVVAVVVDQDGGPKGSKLHRDREAAAPAAGNPC